MIATSLFSRSPGEIWQYFLSHRYRKLEQPQEHYSNGYAEADVGSGAPSRLRRLFLLGSRRPFSTIATILIAALVVATYFKTTSRDLAAGHQQQARHLYLLIPTSHSDSELCKTILTAQILGYPAPYLIHWDTSLDYPDRTSQRHAEKLLLIRDFLQGAFEKSRDSMVVLVDGPHSWFQLRPEVLLSRYFKVLEEANGRLHDSLGSEATEEEDLEPSIVFSAQDHCVASTEDSPSCWAAPEVPAAQRARNLRWLNMGFAVGPVRHMLALYRRAVAKAEQLENGVHDHKIMNEIFGEQELQHENIRMHYLSGWQKVQRWVRQWSGKSVDTRKQEVGYKEGTPDEFGITLDYANELGYSVASGVGEIAWSKQQDTMPSDIAHSMPPFWTVSGHDIPTNNSWSDIDFLTDHKSDSIPAIISFNNDEDKILEIQRDWWQTFWLQPYARELYDSVAVMPNMPVANVLDGSGTEQVFWSSVLTMEKAGVRSMDGTWIPFEQICAGDNIAQELFRDDVGPWTDPAP